MIKIRRGPAPEHLPKQSWHLLREVWGKFAQVDEGRAAYAPFEQVGIFKRILQAPGIREGLLRDFNGKCAFCETPVDLGQIGLGSLPIDHFRPRSNTINFAGDHFPRHYFWLMAEWTNLYLVCPHCSRSRGNRFPLRDEEKRAKVPDPPDFGGPAPPDFGGPAFDLALRALKAEEPLLLDPSNDHPRQHLSFDETSGEAMPLSDKGEISIELYNLNRPRLIRARLEAVKEFEGQLELIQHFTVKDAEELLGDGVPYAAIRRQVFEFQAPSLRVDAEVHALVDLVTSVPFSLPTMGRRAAAFSLDKGDYYRQSRKIERVVLKNFRSIEELTLEMAPGNADSAGWTMILGENGTGKSTMLHGMALALAGERYREQLCRDRGLEASAFVRRVTEGEQPESGSVEVFLSGVPEPVGLEVTRGESRFFGTAEPRVLLLGYGSTRLLPRGREDSATGTEHARVDNLFDPFVPLGDARRWLLEREPEEFSRLSASFAKLLDLGADIRLTQNLEEERIDVRMYDTTVPLEQLSDGYQSVVALTADIMSILGERWGSMAVAEGVVLLDELGAHLHPKWRMGIVKSLRETFPRVQFIVTTHDPLCLRGLETGEVIVMRRGSDRRVAARTDLPPVEALRIDQLLTSEHFGLSSTLEADVERDFDRYYELLAKAELDEEETGRLEKLKERFGSRNLLGETRRERLMLEAIDRHLAREANLDDEAERQQASAGLAKQLESLLSDPEVP